MEKIAIVTPKLARYSETFIKNHIKYLASEKLVFHDGGIPRKLDENIDLLESYSKLKRLYLRYIGRKRYSEPNYDILWAFGKALSKNNVKCVLAEYGTTAGLIVEECKRRNIPIIAHFHGYDASVYSVLKDNQDRYRTLFENAAYIIVVSKAMKRKLLEIGAPREKVVYNVYGPSNEFFDIQSSKESKKLIAIGRFVEKKAPHLTILAFRIVLEEHPDAELCMVGDGPLFRICKELVEHLGLSDKVSFKGVCDKGEIISLIKESSVFVQHSVIAEDGNSEGTPLSVLESMAAGLPIVSTKHAGIPDVVEDGKSGFLVEEGDIAGMAESLIILLDSQELRVEMGEAARERCRRNFSLERHIQVLDDLIYKAISEN